MLVEAVRLRGGEIAGHAGNDISPLLPTSCAKWQKDRNSISSTKWTPQFCILHSAFCILHCGLSALGGEQL